MLDYAGVILMAWAFGSLVSRRRQWGNQLARLSRQALPRRRVTLALSLLPLPFIGNPVILALLLIVSGMAIAPTLIASVAVTQSSVDQTRLTEALAWTSTGMAAGVADRCCRRWPRDRQLRGRSRIRRCGRFGVVAHPQRALCSWPDLEYRVRFPAGIRGAAHSSADRYACS